MDEYTRIYLDQENFERLEASLSSEFRWISSVIKEKHILWPVQVEGPAIAFCQKGDEI